MIASESIHSSIENHLFDDDDDENDSICSSDW